VAWDIADLASEPELSTVTGRIARAADIDARLRRWCASRTAEAAATALQANGVPAGTVQDGGQLMADPQLGARDFWHTTDHPVFGERPFDRFPALWSTTDLQPYLTSGAYIGEHNFEIYRDLVGMSEDDIGAGMADGLFS
jgi:crotonobetainyl-CoA:carnitine CoA-transferase CaiB-like acyl-CoA transferase